MIDKKLLRSGDILLFHTKGLSPVSMGIRVLTQSFFNHCGMYYEDVFGDGYIIEALGNGVVRTPIEEYLDERKHIIKVIRLRQEAFRDIDEYNKGIKFATTKMLTKVGKKYDYWAIAWLGFKYIFKGSYKQVRKYVPVGNPLQSRDKFFCSEVICESCYKISSINDYLFQGNTKQTCDTTTPRDVAKSQWVQYVCGKNLI